MPEEYVIEVQSGTAKRPVSVKVIVRSSILVLHDPLVFRIPRDSLLTAEDVVAVWRGEREGTRREETTRGSR